jgi:hypothetical protein
MRYLHENKMKRVIEDDRNITLQRLIDVVDKALTISLAAQLCARGNKLDVAQRLARERGTASYRELVSASGGSGYLNFQWISESLIRVHSELNKVDLESFWILVRAEQSTSAVYQTPLRAALTPMHSGVSAVRTNLAELFKQYPGNKIGVDCLEFLRQLQESLQVIEVTISKLLSLSPPAGKKFSSLITWRVVLVAFSLFIVTLPLFYWMKHGGPKTTPAAIESHVSQDVASVKATAKSDPISLPAVVFGNVIPLASNVLLLVSAFLTVLSAFSRSTSGDIKRTITELTKAAKILGRLKA